MGINIDKGLAQRVKLNLQVNYPIITAAAALADFASKYAARRCGLVVDLNTGAAFGLFKAFPQAVAAAAAAALLVLLFAVLRLYRSGSAACGGLALAAGGAAANLAERLARGAVSDWIYLPFSTLVFRGGLRFNLADVEIGLGARWVLAAIFREWSEASR